jgi:hypothetical protein
VTTEPHEGYLAKLEIDETEPRQIRPTGVPNETASIYFRIFRSLDARQLFLSLSSRPKDKRFVVRTLFLSPAVNFQ